MSSLTDIVQYYRQDESEERKQERPESRQERQPREVHHYYHDNFMSSAPLIINSAPAPQPIIINNGDSSVRYRSRPRDDNSPSAVKEKSEEKEPERHVGAGLVFGALMAGSAYLLGGRWAKYQKNSSDVESCRDVIKQNPPGDKQVELARRLKSVIKQFQNNRLFSGLNIGSVAVGSSGLAAKLLIPLAISATPWALLIGLGVTAEAFRCAYWSGMQSQRNAELDKIQKDINQLPPEYDYSAMEGLAPSAPPPVY